MKEIDSFPDFSAWLNQPHCYDDFIHSEKANLMSATLNQDKQYLKNDSLPNSWHWIYFNEAIKTADLDADGHQKLGTFIPPLPYHNRMWAGGEMVFHEPLLVGYAAQKHSTVTAVTPKVGKSGKLCFVSVEHIIKQNNQTKVIEKQNIVYRQKIQGNHSKIIVPSHFTNTHHYTQSWQANELMLFRYSALTFNAHLIHYDKQYCQQHSYPDLIIHCPLNATLLLQGYSDMQPNITLKKFTYKAMSPLFYPSQSIVKIMQPQDNENSTKGWIEDENQNLIIQADFQW